MFSALLLIANLQIALSSPVELLGHVLVQHSQEGGGVLIHVSPDDDPYAGVDTEIYFEIQNEEFNTTDNIFKLSVRDGEGNIDHSNLLVTGDLSVATKYVFPETGTYYLTLETKPTYVSGIKREPTYFEFTQQVNRTKTESQNNGVSYVWITLGLLAASIAFTLMLHKAKSTTT